MTNSLDMLLIVKGVKDVLGMGAVDEFFFNPTNKAHVDAIKNAHTIKTEADAIRYIVKTMQYVGKATFMPSSGGSSSSGGGGSKMTTDQFLAKVKSYLKYLLDDDQWEKITKKRGGQSFLDKKIGIFGHYTDHVAAAKEINQMALKEIHDFEGWDD